MKTKRCSRCRETKPAEAFNREAAKPDGRAAYCKACKAAHVSARAKRLRQEDPEFRAKIAARAAVETALASGRLTRPAACARCQRVGAVEGHHADYAQPLDVAWLCRPCHRAAHREEAAHAA